MTERIEPRKFLADSPGQVPSMFQDLEPGKYNQLVTLTEEYFSGIGKGILNLLAGLTPGKAAQMRVRIDNITAISGLENRDMTNKLLLATGLICIKSQTKKEAFLMLKESYSKGVGDNFIGTPVKNQMLINIMRYAGLAVEVAMEKKIAIRERKAASKKQG